MAKNMEVVRLLGGRGTLGLRVLEVEVEGF